MAGLLLVSSCGSDAGPAGEAPSTPGSAADADTDPADDELLGEAVRAAQPDADLLIDALGDERTAVVAVLVATDDGYSLDQILDAATAGRLTGEGQVLGDDDAPLPAELEPTGAFGGTASGAQAAGIRAVPAAPPEGRSPDDVADALYAFMTQGGQPAITTLLILIDRGYNPPQIIEALLGVWDVRVDLVLLDDDGNVVEPERQSRGEYGPLPADLASVVAAAETPGTSASTTGPPAAPTTTGAPEPDEVDDTTSTTPPTPPTTRPPASGDGAGGGATGDVDELVERAVGVYRLTDDLAAVLLSISPYVSGVNYAEGEMVIEPDGTISGSLAWSYTDHVELRDEIVDTSWSVDFVIAPSELTATDDGLVFSSTYSGEICQDAYCVALETPAPITGVVDVDLGLITAGPLPPADDVHFQRI